MKIEYSRSFLRNFRRRIRKGSGVDKKFRERLKAFVKDAKSPELRDHGLKGRRREYRAFWVTGDVRVVYRREGKTIVLYDIGTHNQVY